MYFADDEALGAEMNECFVPVGEISSEAIWITEKKKINAWDIQFIVIDFDIDKKPNYLVKVKCQNCETFH